MLLEFPSSSPRGGHKRHCVTNACVASNASARLTRADGDHCNCVPK